LQGGLIRLLSGYGLATGPSTPLWQELDAIREGLQYVAPYSLLGVNPS